MARLVVEVATVDSNATLLRVVHQEEARPAEFRASNGIQIRSVSCPQWDSLQRTLFIRGNSSPDHGKIISIPGGVVEDVKRAIREFNAQPSPATPAPPQLEGIYWSKFS